MQLTPHTIRIVKEASRRLQFEVLSSNGALLVRSTPYATI